MSFRHFEVLVSGRVPGFGLGQARGPGLEQFGRLDLFTGVVVEDE